jgi:DNA-binding SARP family transcriptional activator
VGTAVELSVESRQLSETGATCALQVRLLGPLAIWRNGVPLALPTSRKVRALFAYLALAPQSVSRAQLCELFWDVPNDPRGELRWCLSKIRPLIDEPSRQRLLTRSDTVRLDLVDCRVDAAVVAAACRTGIRTLEPAELSALTLLFAGDFLDGLDIERCPAFDNWLAAQRRRFRSWHIALLEQLATTGDDVAGDLEKWLELAPFDLNAHRLLLDLLARKGQLRDGEDHLAAAGRLFETEGYDVAPLRNLWRRAKQQCEMCPASQATSTSAPMVTDDDGTEHVFPAVHRASIAVMPFVDQSAVIGPTGGPAVALARDIITRLAKLRSLFVIAQGSVSSLQERHIGPRQAGRMLQVEYIVSGSLQRRGTRLRVAVELAETQSGRIVWAEVFDRMVDDTFVVLDEIGNRIVACIASEIETTELRRAILRPPNGLDAWGAHHRGLWHMYRFNQADNALAQHFFETAIKLDPTFARAHAGLSFAHFQNAFQGWTERGPQIDRAFAAAGQSLMADDRDPAAHWAMGRALWLRGGHDQSIVELELAIDLSPNFAQAHYSLAFIQSQAGDPEAAITSADHSRQLSPFDPLLFGMLGARAMALVRLGQFNEDWGVRAAARPNAHAQILAIAALSLGLAGRLDEARAHLASIQATLPRYSVSDFLTAMHFAPDGEKLFRESARLIGMG